ncbi:MAG: TIGR01777 family oxidoreductase [candidate division WOR-3 bacterium]
MRILITGASGFLGSYISQKFYEKGYEIFVITRKPEKTKFKAFLWNGRDIIGNIDTEGFDSVINLAGENIFSLRWTESKKERIFTSRVNFTKKLCDFISTFKVKPEVFIQASAIGYYNGGDEEINENGEKGNKFLSYVVEEWERASELIEEMGVRRVIARLGIVLGNGGFIKKIELPFKFFLGSIIGNKERWISWIHIEDVYKIFSFFIDKRNLKGIFNLVSPNPVKTFDFYKTFSKVLKRPLLFYIPDFILKIIMGEMADNLILQNQRVIPFNLLKEGYKFKFPLIEDAIKDIYN